MVKKKTIAKKSTKVVKAVKKVAPVKVKKSDEAKEIIAKLCSLYPEATGKTWDKARAFIGS